MSNCDKCPLNGDMVQGDGPHSAKVMLIGEAPGRVEVQVGAPFVGPSGREIDAVYLPLAGLRRRELYVDNVCACRPFSLKGDKKPPQSAIHYCLPRLIANIAKVDPKVVILLGGTPVGALADGLSLKANHGLVFEREIAGKLRKVVVMYHPAAAMHQPSLRATMMEDWKRLPERLKQTNVKFEQPPYVAIRRAPRLWIQQEQLSVDTETAYLDSLKAPFVSAQVCLGDQVLQFVNTRFGLECDRLLGHNIKYDYQVLRRKHVQVHYTQLIDTMIAAYLCGESSLGLKGLTKRYLNYEMSSLQDLIAQAQEQLLYDYIEEAAKQIDDLPKSMQKSLQAVRESPEPAKAISRRWKLRETIGQPPEADVSDVAKLYPEKLVEYGCDDAAATWQLWPIFEQKLQEMDLENLFYNVEMPLVPILADMEKRGMKIDRRACRNLSRKWAVWQVELQDKLQQEGLENPASPQQVAQQVFGKWGHTSVAMTDSGQPSTAAWVLELLAEQDERIQQLLDWRKYEKLRNTYLDKWLRFRGRIHPEYNQVRTHGEDAEGATATGRLSSSGPNWQNVPKRTDEGKAVRSCVVAGPDNILVSADYVQLEWVIMGILANSRKIMDNYIDESVDIHSIHAVELEVDRDTGKRVTYLWVYGGRAGKLAQLLKKPRELTQQWLDGFEAIYPELADWRWRVVEECRHTGYSQTLWGRRRYIPELQTAQNEFEFYEAAKQAFNMPAQGTAADICKLGTVRVNEVLNHHNLQTDRTGLVAQIHDEVLCEIPAKALTRKLKGDILEALKSAGEGLPLTLRVDLKTGKRWGRLRGEE